MFQASRSLLKFIAVATLSGSTTNTSFLEQRDLSTGTGTTSMPSKVSLEKPAQQDCIHEKLKNPRLKKIDDSILLIEESIQGNFSTAQFDRLSLRAQHLILEEAPHIPGAIPQLRSRVHSLLAEAQIVIADDDVQNRLHVAGNLLKQARNELRSFEAITRK